MPDKIARVVRGGWDGHHPVAATDLFVPFLQAHGFTVTVHDTPAIYADESMMDDTSLIVQSVTMSEISDGEVAGLRRAVGLGVGLAGWHGGIVDSYRASTEYMQLVGGQFLTHPPKAAAERTDDTNDCFIRHTVQITAAGHQHPITAGIADFELETEQYWVLHDDLIDVLATTTHAVRDGEPWNRPVVSPAVWVREWGRGRVSVVTPGHDLHVLQDDNIRTFVERSLLWASRTA